MKKLSLPKLSNRAAVAAVLFVQVLIVAALAIVAANASSSAKTLDTPLDKWMSNTIEYKNGSWYADEDIVKTKESVNLLYGPYIKMEKGSYRITIDYECTSQQRAEVNVWGEMKAFLHTNSVRLYSDMNSVSYRFKLDEDAEKFEVLVKYDGNGSIRVNNITIKEDFSGYTRAAAWFVILFVTLDLIWLFYDKIAKNKRTIALLLGIIFMSSLPVFAAGIGDGHDIDVHFMRIEAIADGIMHGDIPVRMSSVWLNGYGYAASVYYGDILLYIPAVLRVAGFSVTFAYNAYVLMINAGTAIIAYYSFKKIFSSRDIGLLCSLAYSTASYRLVNIYVRCAVGEYSAMMFIPLAAAAVHGLVNGDIKNKREYRKNSLLLAAAMTGLITSHILSSEMGAFVLAILCVVLAAYTFRLETLKTYALAVGETLLLSAAFIVPFVDYYFNVRVRVNDRVDNLDAGLIQKYGVHIAEYFAFFRDPFIGELDHHRNHVMLLTPGLVLMLALAASIYLMIRGIKKGAGAMYIYTAFSLLTLYLASNIFPWNVISLQPGLGNMLAQIQFPWRYVELAVIFLTLELGSVISAIGGKRGVQLTRAAALLCIIMTTVFLSMYVDDTRFVDYYDTAELDSCAVGMGEYIRADAYYGDLDGRMTSENVINAAITSRDGCKTTIDCVGGTSDGSITLPVFNYKGYRAYSDAGERLDIGDGENDQIKVTVPANFRGTITVDFIEPFYWRIAEIISLLTVMILALYYGGVFEKLLRRKNSKKEASE